MIGARATRLDLDPTNPGQVLACLGILDLAAEQDPDAVGRFRDGVIEEGRARFEVSAGNRTRIADLPALLRGLVAQEIALPGNRAIAPVKLAGLGALRELDWWLKPARTEESPLKLWAGQVTSLQLVWEVMSALKRPDLELSDVPSLLQQSVPMRSTFGIDPRAAWHSLDVGYSPNDIQQRVLGFPVVELLGAVGLQSFLLKQVDPRSRKYRYLLWQEPLPLPVARAAFSGAVEGLEGMCYEFLIRKRGSFKVFDHSLPVERQ